MVEKSGATNILLITEVKNRVDSFIYRKEIDVDLKHYNTEVRMDSEYNALRRRMSRLRVTHKNRRVSDDMDTGDVEDVGYDDLIKFWKKHNISIAREILPAANRHKARQKAEAKAKGRRKSLEYEDIEINTATGKAKSPQPRIDSKDTIAEETEDMEEAKKSPVPSIRRARKTISEQQHDFVLHRQKSRTAMGAKEKQIVSAKLETAQKPGLKRVDSDKGAMPLKRTDSDKGATRRTGSVKGAKTTTRERKVSESKSNSTRK